MLGSTAFKLSHFYKCQCKLKKEKKTLFLFLFLALSCHTMVGAKNPQYCYLLTSLHIYVAFLMLIKFRHIHYKA